ncbi:GNAT family N-acetyltransferase [Candidatus Roizmanbacteria bacterium]|nr:MAG: GNAT family N-acetyltransferase [Candidatus Roizmanbacteria bacterium]
MAHIIREYTNHDVDGIKQCLIELQDFERMMDPHRLEGIKIAHEYLEHLLEVCEAGRGKIFVVEIDGNIVGMVSVYIEEDKKHFRKARKFALISDLIVMQEYKDQGIIKELLGKTEEYAKSKQVTSLHAPILKGHDESVNGYLRNGFKEFEIVVRKQIE